MSEKDFIVMAFRFRAIPFLATILLVALGVALGNWQTRRAAEKEAIAEKLFTREEMSPLVFGDGSDARPTKPGSAAADIEYRRVRMKGEFAAGWPIFLDNRSHEGRAGFYLAMPFRIAGSNTHVLVLRGWLPRNQAEYARLPEYTTPQGMTTIEGVIVASAGHVMQLGPAAPLKPGALVQNLEVADAARASGLRLEPFFVLQMGRNISGDALVRDWPAPATGVEKHRGYAFQWYALAAMAALFFVITGFRSGRKQDA